MREFDRGRDDCDQLPDSPSSAVEVERTGQAGGLARAARSGSPRQQEQSTSGAERLAENEWIVEHSAVDTRHHGLDDAPEIGVIHQPGVAAQHPEAPDRPFRGSQRCTDRSAFRPGRIDKGRAMSAATVLPMHEWNAHRRSITMAGRRSHHRRARWLGTMCAGRQRYSG